MNALRYCFLLSTFALGCVLEQPCLANEANEAAKADIIEPDGATPQGGKWIQLFNGKNLDGWTPKFKGHELGENFRNTFRVEDGVLKAKFDNWETFDNEQFGHLFYEKPFSHYRLRAEYRFVGDQVENAPGWAIRNNGLMIHGQTAKSMKLDQKFPDCIEVQLLGGTGEGERGTLNVVTPQTHVVIDGKLNKTHVIERHGPTFHGDQWVTVEVEVHGNDLLKHFAYVDGGKVLVAEYTKPQLDDGTMLSGGTISIQAETHPTEFRKIELLELKKVGSGK
ncbi:3-keto-disaccharide hydrolase [Adhaeretor mobilis]|uniref:3-keto-alpha-glucoside-1,2-lyase/3-keto-2-hydroxy-glucal hydratase domain-containing protein n=1 Tax=Adhaeretor mobilis TaxID=1930276 RepID=A0A517MQD9_9BACT|nr:DUF1080 domain-containing protein [Adhaeretor mobilis]QDS97100.1 hypothetical protein HG15A2_03600 [Adhaeretor mobilis]